MKSSLLILAAGLFGMLSDARGDGFIVVERPFLVRPGHFPFAPLEVTSHHVEVKIDSQVAVTSIDQSSTTRTISDWKVPTCFQCRKARTSTSSAWRSAGKWWTPNCYPRKRRAQIYEEIVRKMRDPALLEYADAIC
jgi:Ca-activated chloride channel family protein